MAKPRNVQSKYTYNSGLEEYNVGDMESRHILNVLPCLESQRILFEHLADKANNSQRHEWLLTMISQIDEEIEIFIAKLERRADHA